MLVHITNEKSRTPGRTIIRHSIDSRKTEVRVADRTQKRKRESHGWVHTLPFNPLLYTGAALVRKLKGLDDEHVVLRLWKLDSRKRTQDAYKERVTEIRKAPRIRRSA